MERALLLITMLVGVLAGQASANMFTLDKTTATEFREVGVSDFGLLLLVVDRNGTPYYIGPSGPSAYGSPPMQGQVGFAGVLGDLNGDHLASMAIGGAINSPATYDGFSAYIANDSKYEWQYQLYVSDAQNNVHTPGTWTSIGPGDHLPLTFNFGSTIAVNEVGFYIQGDDFGLGPGHPGNPDGFRTSVVVPVPGAVLLGFLGLGVAGLKLRRFV
jgi:hypothetical protein